MINSEEFGQKAEQNNIASALSGKQIEVIRNILSSMGEGDDFNQSKTSICIGYGYMHCIPEFEDIVHKQFAGINEERSKNNQTELQLSDIEPKNWNEENYKDKAGVFIDLVESSIKAAREIRQQTNGQENT